MKIKLYIHQSNQVKSVDLKEQTVNHLRFEAQSLYQLVDENNQALEQVFWKKQGDDVLFFLNEHDKQPILVLHDGNDFLATMHFPQAQTSALIETVKANQVSAAPNWALLSLGGAALLGGGLALAKGGSSSRDKNRADNATEKVDNKTNPNKTQNDSQKLRDVELAKQKAEQAQKLAENALKKANDDLASALRDKKTAEDALKTAQNSNSKNIADLQNQLTQANQKVQAAENAKKAAEQALSDLRGQLSQAEIAQKQAEQAKQQLENQAHADKTRLQNDLKQANQNLATALKEKQQAENALKAAQNSGSQNISDLQNQLKAANEKVQAAEKAQKLAENQAQADKTRLENELKQANDSLAAALNDKKAAEDALKAAQNSDNKNIADLQKQLDEANQKVQAAETAKNNTETELNNVRNQLAQTETDKANLQNELNNANAAKAQAETELQTANDNLENALRDKKTAEDNLKAAQEQGKTDIANLQTQLNEANEKVKAAEDAKKLAETQAQTDKTRLETELQTANTNLENALRDKKTAEDNLKAAQEQGKTDIANLQNQLKAANDKVKAAEDAKVIAETVKNAAESEASRLNTQLSQANTDLATALSDKKTAEDALAAKQGEIDALQTQLNEANEKVQTAATDLSNLRNQFENDLNEAKTAKEQAEANLKTAQDDLANAIAAKETAEKAQENAENALKAAQEKGEKADALQAQLNEAKTALNEKELALTDAQNAKNLAEIARNNALKAQDTAEKAKEAAEKALADFQAAQAEAIKNNPPQIRFNDLTADNIINSSEASSEIEISGSVNNMQPDDVLTIKIGDTSHTVPVEQGNFVLKINGNVLADKPVVLAEVVRGNEKVAEKSHTYDVDTQIDTPVITFNPITEDNIINLDESKQNAIEVSGTVQHFQQGEQLLVKIGETSPIRVAIQDNGTFSFWVAGQTFANHPSIQASLTTKDEAGNTASASKMAEYTVDVIAPTPSITINPIAEDDIINLDESKQETTEISGTVSNVENGKQVMLLCSCQSCSSPSRVVEIPVTVQSDNTFRVSVNTAELLKYDTIKAQIQTQDAAKNTGKNETTKTYRKDLVLNKPEITIDNIENVNRKKWLDNDFRISGSLKTDADVPNQEAQITIKINGQVFAERVSHNGEKWTLSVSQNQLQAWDKQTLNVTAEIVVHDEAKNTNNATSESKQFQVSINAAELSIDLNEIGRIQPNQDLAIAGKVTGAFKPTDKVVVLVGTTPMENQLDIGSDGQFTGTIAKEHLTGNNTIHVLISGSDDFGNPYENVSDSENYSFPSDNDVILSFNDITGDNHINVTEKSQVITVSGKVSGTYADEQKGKTVNMTVNNQTLTATVKDDLSFEFHVSGEDLIRHNGYQLSGSLKDGERTVTALKDYTVAPDALAKIHLNDVNLGLAEEIGSVRLSGKLDFRDSIFGIGYNKYFVRAIKLKIGEQIFDIGINKDDNTFFLDLTHNQYQQLKGKHISYEWVAYNDNMIMAPWSRYKNVDYYFLGHPIGNNMYIFKDDMIAPNIFDNESAKNELKKIQITFDNSVIQNTKQLQLNSSHQTLISGKVIGANIDDEIVINIGGATYTTLVEADSTFNIKVANEDLQKSSYVRATLMTTNAKREQVALSDVESIEKHLEVSSLFVNPHNYIPKEERITQHSDPNYNFAYFIDGIDLDTQQLFLNYQKTPFGTAATEPVTIKYYFANHENDYNNGGFVSEYGRIIPNTYEDFSDEFKNEIRKAYELYESTTNLKFVEVNNRQDADTVFIAARFEGGDGGSSGYGIFGGNVYLNTHYAELNEFKKYINFHEILHSLGANHIDANSQDSFNTKSYAQAEATTEVSVMSYKDDFIRYSGRYNLSLYDLAYLHYRFGVNKNRNTSNDIYRFNQYNPMMSDGNIYIWDAAGVDTFDASKENEGVNVNLTPGSWIYKGEVSDTFLIKKKTVFHNYDTYTTVEGREKFFFETLDSYDFSRENYFIHYENTYVEGQAFIGYGTQIENLIGSAHADVLKGNKADNNIYGGDGNDQIWGDDGNDYLDGGKGTDILHGGLGNDIYVVDNIADQITELDNQGTDTVYAHVNYRLSDFVENLSLFGNAMTGEGNALNNIIQGNDENNTLRGEAGNDQLDGGRGSDHLTGGDGTDTFVFSALLDGSVDTIVDFDVSQDKIKLAASVFEGLTANNLAERIKYNAQNGHLSYDPDGSGNADAIHFANISPNLDLHLDERHFILA